MSSRSSVVELESLNRSARRINFRFQGPNLDSPLISSDPLCENPLQLEHLIRFRVSSNKSTPNFKLEVRGFKDRKPRFLKMLLKPYVEAFAFTVPLPTPASSSFYSIPDNAPCLRGGVLSKDPSIEPKKVGTHGWDRSASSESSPSRRALGFLADFDEDQAQAQVSKKGKSIREKWNKRVDSMIFPPWVPLDQEGKASLGNPKPTATLQDCLEDFVNDGSGRFKWMDCRKWIISGRWLIGPQTIYGWDQSLLLQELNDLAQEINEEDPTAKLSHIEIKVKSPPPFFALNFVPRHDTFRARFTRLHPLLVILTSVVANSLVFIQSLIGITKDTVPIWMPITSLTLFPLWFLLAAFGDLPSIHDSIGLAWCMTQWIKINFPSSMSEEKVKEILKAQGGRDGEDGKGSFQVRLSEDGWERMNGMKELDWINLRKSKLLAAMRERKKRDLSDEW